MQNDRTQEAPSEDLYQNAVRRIISLADRHLFAYVTKHEARLHRGHACIYMGICVNTLTVGQPGVSSNTAGPCDQLQARLGIYTIQGFGELPMEEVSSRGCNRDFYLQRDRRNYRML